MKRTKMLVVEDNEDNRRILVLRLRHWGEFDIRECRLVLHRGFSVREGGSRQDHDETSP